MSYNFLYVVDPLESLKIVKDTSVAFMEEAQTRNINNFACEIEELFLKDGRCHALAAKTFFDGKTIRYTEEKKIYSLDDFQVVFMRKDPPVDMRFISSLWLLRAHDPKKTIVLNDPNSLLLANEKLFGLDILKDFVPKTIVTSNLALIKDFAKKEKKIVVKPLNKAGGRGVLVLEYGDRNLNSSIELAINYEQNAVVVQKYIENADEGDKRILLLGGEVLGAVLRKPFKEDFRSNLNYGGEAHPTTVTKKEYLLIEKLKPYLVSMGLHFVGIDVIQEHLTEINVTSPTTIRIMEQFYNVNFKSKVLDYVESLVRKIKA